MTVRIFAPLIMLLAAAPLPAQQRTAPFVIEQTGAGYPTIDAAVTAVRDDKATILIDRKSVV